MIRLTLLSLLHRPQCLQTLPKDALDADETVLEYLKSSKTRLKATARELTCLIQVMLQHDMIRYMPTSGVPILLSASMTHLLDLDAQDDDIRDASIYRLELVMRAFQQLREVYASADSAVTYLGMIIRKTGKGAREQVAMLAPEFDPNATSIPERFTHAINWQRGSATQVSGLAQQSATATGPDAHACMTEPRESIVTTQRGPIRTPGGATAYGAATTIDSPYRASTSVMANQRSAPKSCDAVSEYVSDYGTGGNSSMPLLGLDNSLEPLGNLDYDAGAELFGAQYNLLGADFSWFASSGENATDAGFGTAGLHSELL
jgi:hypothetical protein